MWLHLISDRTLVSRPLEEALGEAARAGVDVIQLREPGLPDRDLVALVRRVLAAVRDTAARVVVNDRFDIALVAGADGVHLKSSGIPVAVVRDAVPRTFLVGRSVHGPGEAREAESGGADYLVAGPVFATPSKARYGLPPLGLEGLARVARAVRIPVVGVGGIGPGNANDLLARGAAGVAAIRAFLESEDVAAAVRGMRVATAAPERTPSR